MATSKRTAAAGGSKKASTKAPAKKSTAKAKAFDVEKDLLKVTGEPSKKAKETDAEYRARLGQAALALDDKKWAQLDEKSQVFANHVSLALSAGKEPPAFDAKLKQPAEEEELEDEVDLDEEELEDEVDLDEDEELASKKSKKSTKAPKSEKPAREKKAKKEKPEPSERDAAVARGTGGVKGIVRRMLIENPELTKDEVLKAINKMGYNLSHHTLNSVFYNTLVTLNDLKAMGRLKDPQA